MNCATIANGITNACKSINLSLPLIVRLEGELLLVSLSSCVMLLHGSSNVTTASNESDVRGSNLIKTDCKTFFFFSMSKKKKSDMYSGNCINLIQLFLLLIASLIV